jgi:hypothetical protein
MDILGGWVCTQNARALYFPSTTPAVDLVDEIQQLGHFYDSPNVHLCLTGGATNSTDHIIAWDSSAELLYN